ncbi:adaptor protein MecA [uncultured Lactobacillus sp.]|uniref:adaptor protein MecA n=1 Tax=uncultured Lactobacillus sp. TaxID=153152 RepID=UPI00266565BC|nr:adaptor protein MecA [uncultured Lactobacillus sp.]
MRVEKVNDNTLRVSMTREDLNKRGLKILDLLGNRERVQEFFLSILHEVDKEHSFASDAPVTFQVMPNDGGIDLLITKMKGDSGGMSEEVRRFFDPSDGQDDDDDAYGEEYEAGGDEPRPYFDLDPNDDANTEMDPVVMKDLNLDANDGDDDYWNYQDHHCVRFADFDELLALADGLKVSDLASSVYYFKGQFYLKLAFMDENYEEIKPADAWAIANEFGYRVEDDEMDKAQKLGQCIFQQDALGALRRQHAGK